MLALALTLLALAIGLAIWTVAASADEKATIRASLRQLDGYQVDNVREQEMLKPARERTVAPVMDRLVDLGTRFTPDGYVDKVRAKLIASGNRSPRALDRSLAVKVVCTAAVPVMILLVFTVLAMSGMVGLLVAGLLAAIFVMGTPW
ncbi:hypothetical protein BH23ACT2_BH23ACT2_17320 [soil metagenome]